MGELCSSPENDRPWRRVSRGSTAFTATMRCSAHQCTTRRPPRGPSLLDSRRRVGMRPGLSAALGDADLRKSNISSQIRSGRTIAAGRRRGSLPHLDSRTHDLSGRAAVKVRCQSRNALELQAAPRSAKKSDPLAPKASSIIMKAEQSSGARPEGCFVSIHHGSIEGHSAMLVCAAH